MQHIPYEGFPNADMDMQGNKKKVAAFFNGRYRWAATAGATSFITAYYDRIRHEMNGDAADRYPPSLSITGFGDPSPPA